MADGLPRGGAGAGAESAAVVVDAALPARGFTASVGFPGRSVTAIVGPNGAGKSTLLGLVSGLLRPASGTVAIDGRTVAAPGAFVPPHRRPVAVLEQRPLLFPHLSVLENVAFGVRSRGASKRDAQRRAEEELEAVGALGFGGRRPGALSGGEAQRVALARALATDPAVLLLDEPLASLDVSTAAAMRQVLVSRLRAAGDSKPTVLLVTHDPLDVWALADQVVALADGRVSAQGSVETILGRPPTRFLAELSGVNLLAGTTRDCGQGSVVLGFGRDHVAGLWDGDRPAAPGQHALATFPPAAVALFADASEGSPRNTWRVRVSSLEAHGATVRVHLELADGQHLAADLTAQGVAALSIAPGSLLAAQVKATQVTLFPRP